jgi:hypothetical protein
MDKSVALVVYSKKGKSFLAAVLLTFTFLAVLNAYISDWQNLDNVPVDAAEIIDKCN